MCNDETRNKILRFIDTYTRQYRCCPSIREIAAAVGLKSTSTAHGYIQRMKHEGLIFYQPYKSRTVQIKKKTWQHSSHIRMNIRLKKRVETTGQNK